ncbi:hypothetical protein UFOVP552_19, partial [uncultured Caudovirales phage]
CYKSKCQHSIYSNSITGCQNSWKIIVIKCYNRSIGMSGRLPYNRYELDDSNLQLNTKLTILKGE